MGLTKSLFEDLKAGPDLSGIMEHTRRKNRQVAQTASASQATADGIAALVVKIEAAQKRTEELAAEAKSREDKMLSWAHQRDRRIVAAVLSLAALALAGTVD